MAEKILDPKAKLDVTKPKGTVPLTRPGTNADHVKLNYTDSTGGYLKFDYNGKSAGDICKIDFGGKLDAAKVQELAKLDCHVVNGRLEAPVAKVEAVKKLLSK